jgi:alpha-1,3/alpha-1,6-mannosyltransferase
MTEKMKAERIVFFHPDLGIGGAERLIVDAAVGLQKRGHKVTIFTSHCDPQHCFDEARDGMSSHSYIHKIWELIFIGTLDVRVRGNTIIPATIFSRFSILCAILRQIHLILLISLSSELSTLKPTVFFADQLSAGLPVLQALHPAVPTLFYCHFPDLLLAKGRKKWYKALYRLPFDAWEEWSMSFAASIAVNSAFTKSIVTAQWPSLASSRQLDIVYPCVDVSDKPAETAKDDNTLTWQDTNIILSINRFEGKKNIALAIRAFAGLPNHARRGVRLVLAGGYDPRVVENVVYHQDLLLLAEGLRLKTATTKNLVTALRVPDDVDVLFLLSVPSGLKDALLRSARLLVYTPANEHFGIVPLEAMLVGTPVLAANTGGPLETVVDGVTGWLRDPEKVEDWTGVMNSVLHKMTPGDLEKMGNAGRKRVRKEFSEESMAERLERLVGKMGAPPRSVRNGIIAVVIVILAVVLGPAIAAWKLYDSR